ncbi:hypothetical protein ACO0SA_002640 [Hanseniaspora valbyensis]
MLSKLSTLFLKKNNKENVNLLTSKPLFSDIIKIVDSNSNKVLNLNNIGLKELQLRHFYKNVIKFNPEEMNPLDRARFYEVVDNLTYSQRSRKHINLQFINSSEAVRKFENNKYVSHLDEVRLFSNNDLISKKMIYEAAKLFVEEEMEILKLPTIKTKFQNKYISDYLPPDNGLLNSQRKKDKLPESFQYLWQDDWYFTKLKGTFANVNLSLATKQFIVHDCDLFTLLYIPDFHPFAAALTKSNPAIVITKAKNTNMPIYQLRESTKLYKRLFWQHYIKLRFDKNNVYNEYKYLDTVFGKVELAPEGIAKKGFYFFKIKRKIDINKENEVIYNVLNREMFEAMRKTANISWRYLQDLCKTLLKENQYESLKAYNDIFTEKQLGIIIQKIEPKTTKKDIYKIV